MTFLWLDEPLVGNLIKHYFMYISLFGKTGLMVDCKCNWTR